MLASKLCADKNEAGPLLLGWRIPKILLSTGQFQPGERLLCMNVLFI